MPTRRATGLLAHLSGAVDEILVGRELAQAHRASRMEAVGGDSYLSPEPELEAVGETRGGVDEDRRRVDGGQEAASGRVALGDDRVGEPRAVAFDELERLVEGSDDPHRKNLVEILGRPIFF